MLVKLHVDEQESKLILKGFQINLFKHLSIRHRFQSNIPSFALLLQTLLNQLTSIASTFMFVTGTLV